MAGRVDPLSALRQSDAKVVSAPLDIKAELKHWRAFQGKKPLRGAPVPGFRILFEGRDEYRMVRQTLAHSIGLRHSPVSPMRDETLPRDSRTAMPGYGTGGVFRRNVTK